MTSIFSVLLYAGYQRKEPCVDRRWRPLLSIITRITSDAKSIFITVYTMKLSSVHFSIRTPLHELFFFALKQSGQKIIFFLFFHGGESRDIFSHIRQNG